MSLVVGRAFSRAASLRGLLQREVAGRPGIGVAEAGQQIDVGGPRADAVHGGERRMRLVGRHAAERRRDRARRLSIALRDRLERPDLRCRQPERARACRRARAARGVIERIERRGQPAAGSRRRSRPKAAATRRSRRGRQSRRRGGAAAAAGERQHLAEARIGRDQRARCAASRSASVWMKKDMPGAKHLQLTRMSTQPFSRIR